MKKHSKLYSTLAAMAITTMIAASSFFASDVQAMDKEKTTTIGTHNKEVVTMKGGYSILGSKFIGMEVENPQGENVGEVKDIMIDSTGKVRYAAVSYSGFMDMGDKMYAVPMDAFTFKRDKGMFYDDVTLILNVTQEQLKDEKGFDNKNWPNLEDESYRNDLDTRYKIKKTGHMMSGQGMSDNKMEGEKNMKTSYPMNRCMGRMKGMSKGCMMFKSMVPTNDGGVIVMIGNKLYKYDMNLNLKKETEISVDYKNMNKMMMEMHNMDMTDDMPETMEGTKTKE